MAKSQLKAEWKKIFSDYPIIETINQKGYFIIEAKEIKKYYEPRLMAKFDSRKQLPSEFSKNKLGILPLDKKRYIIGKFDLFADLKSNKKLVTIGAERPPEHVETIDIDNISSETTALLCANICGILNDFFKEDVVSHVIGGRMGSGTFDIRILDEKTTISKSQIEIDGGFESDSSIYLVEVKRLIHEDFLVRQVYYPYRTWVNKLRERGIDKTVRNIFLTYSDGIFYLREYEFEELEEPTSIKLVREDKYSIIKNALRMTELEKLVYKANIVKEPKIPFPQSDDLNKVISLCESIYQLDEGLSKQAISESFGFAVRQAGYYGSSAVYLSLAKYEENKYSLTNEGIRIFSLPLEERQYELAKIILSHEIFNIVMKHYLNSAERPTLQQITTLLIDCEMYNVSKDKTTFKRRCSTVISWTEWILDRVSI